MHRLLNFPVLATLVAVAAVVGLSRWLQQQWQAPAPTAQPVAAGIPDYYIDDFRVINMGEHGRPRSQLNGAKLVHFPGDDHSVVTDPRLVFYPRQGSAWHVSATHAWMASNDRLVKLQGAVHIQRPASAANRPVSVDTRDLQVDPDKSYAETGAQTVIHAPGARLEGLGMRAWFDSQRLELLSSVRGSYQRAKP